MIDDKKKVIVGSHIVKINKHLSPDGEKIVCSLKINESLKDLLSFFIIRGPALTEELVDNDVKVKRFKIKSVLRRSTYWTNIFNYFFTKEIIEDMATEIAFIDNNQFSRFAQYMRSFKELVKEMEELKRDEEITITYAVQG